MEINKTYQLIPTTPNRTEEFSFEKETTKQKRAKRERKREVCGCVPNTGW